MYHKVIVAGNLGGDPEMRYMPDGTAVTNFSVATNRRWTGRDGEQQEETVWIRVSVWGKRAEVANQYLSKGQKVLVEGRLRPDENGGPRIWTAQDGTVRASYEISATDFAFLSSRDESYGGYEGGDASSQGGPTAEEEDDIPF